VVAAWIILTVLQRGGHVSSLIAGLLVPITCYMVAALGLNLNVGISGELNLGQAGFMSVGAFTAVCISGYLAASIPAAPLRLAIALIGGAFVAVIFGLVIGIPVLKLQGDYLAIVTLAFGRIIKSIITNMYLGFDENGFQFSFVQNTTELAPGGKMLLNGPMGATGTQRIATFTAGVILVLIALMIIYNLIWSKSGRAIMAARDNRIAAELSGINITNTKMLSFVVSAGLAGAAGALYGLNYSTLVPNKFDFNTSILILVYVVLGGLGNMNGTMIATVVLVLLPELLRSLQDYRMLIYAIVLIAIMLVTNNAFLQAKAAKLRESLIKGKKGAKQS
jgi:branched-chain amino acid transport system permease protein